MGVASWGTRAQLAPPNSADIGCRSAALWQAGDVRSEPVPDPPPRVRPALAVCLLAAVAVLVGSVALLVDGVLAVVDDLSTRSEWLDGLDAFLGMLQSLAALAIGGCSLVALVTLRRRPRLGLLMVAIAVALAAIALMLWALSNALVLLAALAAVLCGGVVAVALVTRAQLPRSVAPAAEPSLIRR